MCPTSQADVAEVVARFFAQRRSGARVSIDQVLDASGDILNRTQVRTAALRAITYRIRGSDAAKPGSSEPTELTGCAPAETLPELEGYDLIDCVGRGGMGVVYEAYQQSTGRRVAVKFLLDGATATEAARRRFEREVELVVRLAHPHIVSVVDSGIHHGRYFFVMEYVEGLPLDEALRPGQADIRDTLRLMRTICEAVDYAHQRGVLHRDLKPSNIQIDERGAPHLLDFGLAKGIDPQSQGPVAMTLSEPGQLLGTLGYMSPEQARGELEQVSVRSDVYSLGALLYELLTGELPCSVDGPLGDVLERIVQHDPPRPSLHRRHLDADVDAIVLKALEKSSPARYSTAAALAEDIQRYLMDQSIVARRAGLGRRVWRWTRRNWRISAVAAAALLAIAITVTVSFVRIRGERDRAVRAEQRAEVKAATALRTEQFLTDTLASVDPRRAQGRDVRVRDVLDEAAARIETELADQPEVEAAVRHTIGLTYYRLGRYDAAEPHLRAAVARREDTLGADHLETAYALHDLAVLMERRDEYEAAEDLYRRALPIYRRELGQDSQTATLLRNLGGLLREKAEYDGAEELLREALEMDRARHGDEHSSTADGMNDLAVLLLERGDYDGAETLFREALAIERKVSPDHHPAVPAALANLAALLARRGSYEEAETLFREALEISRVVLGDAHADTAMTMNNLAMVLKDQGKYDEAATMLRQALDVWRRALGPDDESVATGLNNLALVLRHQGELAEAEELYRQALAIHQQVYGDEHPSVALSLSNLATVLAAQEQYDSAEPLAREALAIYRGHYGDEHPQVARVSNNLAVLLRDKGDYEAAEPLFRDVLALARELFGDEHPRVATVLANLAWLRASQKDLAEARALYHEALGIRRRALPAQHPHIGDTLMELGRVMLESGDAVGAEPLLREGVEIRRQAVERPGRVASAESRLGRCLTLLGRYEEAEEILLRCYPVLRDEYGDEDSLTRVAAERIVQLYEAWGRPDRADAWRQQTPPAP